jgi:tetratricopeptide (TPR) repeat protein
MAKRPLTNAKSDPLAPALEQARRMIAAGRHPQAFGALTAMARRHPSDPRIQWMLGTCNGELGRYPEAIEAFTRAVHGLPDEPRAVMGLIFALQRGGRHEDALTHTNRLLRKRPGDVQLRRMRVSLLLDMGRNEEAGAAFDELRGSAEFEGLPVRERAVITNTGARLAPGHRDARETIADLEQFAGDERVSPPVRTAANWHLGRLYDGLDEPDAAFAAHKRSKSIIKHPWDPDLHSRRIDALIECWKDGCGVPFAERDGSRLVFVTGMMRSGTSLTEQMLAQLDDVTPGGEMNAVGRQVGSVEPPAGDLRRLPLTRERYDQKTISAMASRAWQAYDKVSTTSRFVTDKQPENVYFVPLIARMFPGCRIVHTTRDPVDTCLSNYFQAFGRPHPQTHDLAWLGRYYRDYERMAEAWRTLPDVNMIELRYEDLVRDPKTHLGRAMAFIGLEWDDRVLEFHRSDRAVRTSSRDQVRRPLYTSSVRKHTAYAAHLGPLYEALGLGPGGEPEPGGASDA